MDPSLQAEQDFEDLLESHRPALRRFLFSLTASQANAEDLLQETSLVLWRKREDFEPGTNFKAWSFQVAFNIARSYRRKASRSRELTLPDEALMDRLAEEQEAARDQWEREIRHLPTCLGKLKERQREFVVRRYMGKSSVQELASEEGMTPNAMSQLLFRIKRALQKCVERELQLELESEEGLA